MDTSPCLLRKGPQDASLVCRRHAYDAPKHLEKKALLRCNATVVLVVALNESKSADIGVEWDPRPDTEERELQLPIDI